MNLTSNQTDSLANGETACLFCDAALPSPPAGSVEHVFLSSIGGRLTTTRATCRECNNAFASNETKKADDELSGLFIQVRNALRIVSGRKDPPPTIAKAGEISSGIFYDLAPGLVPIPQRASIPAIADMPIGSEHNIVAKDQADATRVLTILKMRGLGVTIGSATSATHMLPPTNVPLRMQFDPGYSSVAKSTVVAACVIYGNGLASKCIDRELRAAARTSSSSIRNYVGFDYRNSWVNFCNIRAHSRTPDANPNELSGFEHHIAFADVEGRWVAYAEYFGGYRFSIDLGVATGLPPKVLIVNPRSMVAACFEADVTPPATYLRPSKSTSTTPPDSLNAHLVRVTKRALDTCAQEAMERKRDVYMDDLLQALIAAGDDDQMRSEAIAKWFTKISTVESGGMWQEATDISID